MQGIELHAQLIESVLFDSVLLRLPKIDVIELGIVLIGGLFASSSPRTTKPVLAAHRTAAGVACLAGEVSLGLPASWSTAPIPWSDHRPSSVYHCWAPTFVRHRPRDGSSPAESRARARGEGPARGRAQCRAGDPDGASCRARFPLPASRPEIDLDALIEPARVIGGDLYDFLLIDQNRLFFAIADVSGKGTRQPYSWR